MDSGTIVGISLGAILIAIAAFTIYTSFGPPSKQLKDPFDDHED